MNKERTLVVLAAGIGSRFGEGIKQLQPVGPEGEVIMDYAIFDALTAGFNRVIFIIRRDIQELFEEIVGSRIRPFCQARGVEILCAYQEKEDLPQGFTCPQSRKKPWGTGQALLACRGMLSGGFAVINADDYYGKDGYEKAWAFLDKLPEGSENHYGLVGFRLGNTLSQNGGVTRGVCRVGDEGELLSIAETKNIRIGPDGQGYVEVDGKLSFLDGDVPVSMNMWAFTPDVLEKLEKRFVRFLEAHGEDDSAEFLIPVEIGGMLSEKIRVEVLPTGSHWFGMTYAADLPQVSKALGEMAEQGIYPKRMFV